MDASEELLQATIRRNVKVLMAVHSIDTARDLARIMDKAENQVARQLRGTRAWQLSDLPALADALNVTAADLLGDTASVVGAVAPVSVGTGRGSKSATDQYASLTRRQINGGYSAVNGGVIIQFPLVRRMPQRELAVPPMAGSQKRNLAPAS